MEIVLFIVFIVVAMLIIFILQQLPPNKIHRLERDSYDGEPEREKPRVLIAKRLGTWKVDDGAYETDPIILGNVYAHVDLDDFKEEVFSNDTEWMTQVEVQLKCPSLPAWFKLECAPSCSTLTLGKNVFKNLGAKDLRGILSTQSHATLMDGDPQGALGHNSSAQFKWKMRGRLFYNQAECVKLATACIGAAHMLERNLPQTREELDKLLAISGHAPELVWSAYRRLLKRGDDSFLIDAVSSHTPAALLLEISPQLPQDRLLSVIEQATWDTERALVFLSAQQRQPTGEGHDVQEAVRAKALEVLTTAPTSQEQIKRHPDAVLPLLRHFWSDAARRPQCLALGDMMMPRMHGDDALAWMDQVLEHTSEPCPYERFGALLKAKIAPDKKPELLRLLIQVIHANPDLLADARWVRRTFALLRFGDETHADALSSALVEHTPGSLYTELEELVRDPLIEDHPLLKVVKSVRGALRDKQRANSGSLSLAPEADTQQGQLSIAGEKGALSAPEDS